MPLTASQLGQQYRRNRAREAVIRGLAVDLRWALAYRANKHDQHAMSLLRRVDYVLRVDDMLRIEP